MGAAWRTHVHLVKSYSEDHSRHFGSPVRDNFKEDSHVHLARRGRAGSAKTRKGMFNSFRAAFNYIQAEVSSSNT